MSKIKIKKTVQLDFLGDEYKDAYVTFQSLPVSQIETAAKRIANTKEDQTISTMLSLLKENFLGGKFPVDGKLEDLTAEDIDGLDQESMLKCFEAWSGISYTDASKAGLDPKDSKK